MSDREYRVLNRDGTVIFGPADTPPSAAPVWDDMDRPGAPHSVEERTVGDWGAFPRRSRFAHDDDNECLPGAMS